MHVFPKFIIEKIDQLGYCLIIGKCAFHKQLATDPKKVKGGGWFRYLEHTDMFVFGGESHDFGPATLEDIKHCIENSNVYYGSRLHRNITTKHNFGYDTGTEIIELKANQ